MGTYIIEEARRRDTPKTVLVGTVCSYPKEPPVPFKESLWQGYPEETNAPYGIAKLAQLVHAQSNRAQYGQNCVYLIPTNLYGPGRQVPSAVSHVIPALIKKCVDAKEPGSDHIEVWGVPAPASPEFLYVDDAAEGVVLAAERYDGADPVNLGADHGVPIRRSRRAHRRGRRIRWRDPMGYDEARRQPRRRVGATRAEQLFGFMPRTTFEHGLRNTVDWYLGHREEAEKRSTLGQSLAMRRSRKRRNRALRDRRATGSSAPSRGACGPT